MNPLRKYTFECQYMKATRLQKHLKNTQTLTFKHCPENDVLTIKLRAWPWSRGDQELDVPVVGVELDVIVIVILR